MTLFDCGIPYTALPECVLDLTSKVSLILALEVYRQRSLNPLEVDGAGNLSPYERRKRSETARELLRYGVIQEAEDTDEDGDGDWYSSKSKSGYALVDLDMCKDRSLAKERLVIPAQFDYRSLSAAGIKLLIAFYSLVRYSRTPFRVEMTQTELATKARLADKSIRAALKELTEGRLIKTKQLWRKATQITLLDPESGVELYYIGDFYRRRLEKIPVFDRYKILLSDYDPRGQLQHMRGPVVTHTVNCPFCKGKRSRTFTFEADELGAGTDRWRCHRCKRSGNSARLWAKLSPWIGKRNWRTMIAEATGQKGQQVDGADEEEEAAAAAAEAEAAAAAAAEAWKEFAEFDLSDLPTGEIRI